MNKTYQIKNNKFGRVYLKKTIILRYFFIFSVIGYLGVMAYFFIIGNPIEEWFSLAILILGFNSLLKSWFWELDSSLFIGSMLIFIGVASLIQNFFMFDIENFYPWYIFSLSFASIMVFSIFRQKTHLKLFVISCLEVIILFIYKARLLPNILFYVINTLYLLFILTLFIRSYKKNTRS